MDDPQKKKFTVGKILRNKVESESKANPQPGPAGSERDGRAKDNDSAGALPSQPVFGKPPSGIKPIGVDAPTATETKVSSIEIERPSAQVPFSDAVPVPGFDAHRDDEIDVFRYVSIILRRRFVVLAAMVAAFVLAFFSSLQKPTLYQAKTQLLYKAIRSNEVLQGVHSYELWIDRENQITTYMELLKSPEILGRVVDKLSLPFPGTSIMGMIEVSRIEKSSIVEILVKNKDAHLSADIANELAQTLIDYNLEVSTQDIVRTIQKIEEQIEKTGVALKEKEETLRKFQERNQFVHATEETQLEVRKLSEIELNLQKTELGISETHRRLRKIEEQLKKQNVDVKLENELTRLEVELATSASQYGQEHPKTKATKVKIESMKELIEKQRNSEYVGYSDNPIRLSLMQSLTKYRADYVALETKRFKLLDTRERINTAMEKLPAKELEQLRLMRDKQTVEDVYNLLKKKYEEAKIKRDSQASALVQIERASVPKFPLSSKRAQTVVIGILIGLFVGVGIAFLLEYMDQSIKAPADVEGALKLPLLGGIPQLETEQNSLGTGVEKENLLEPYRLIRTNLQYSLSGGGSKAYLITSAMQGEGKSSKSSKLAVSFALDGKRVLLVDADLRRSAQHRIFQLEKGNGLAELLTGQSTLEQVCKRTVFPNLWVVTGGGKPPNPSEILGSESMTRFIKEAKRKFDVIVLDTPAALPVTDAYVLAPKVDGLILVVRVFKTPAKAALQVKNGINRVGGHWIGCVLNRIPHGKSYYAYYYYSYYGYYGYHYNYDDDARSGSTRWKGVEKWIESRRAIKDRLGKTKGVVPLAGILFGLFRKKRILAFMGVVVACFATAWVSLHSIARTRTEQTLPKADTLALTDRQGWVQANQDKMAGKAIEDIAFGQGLGNAVSPVDFEKRLSEWKDTFNTRDVELFLGFYVQQGLRTPAGSYEKWELYQRKRFASRPQADLTIGELIYLSKSPTTVSVEFSITIKYPKSTIRARFRQTWVLEKGRWLITLEKIT